MRELSTSRPASRVSRLLLVLVAAGGLAAQNCRSCGDTGVKDCKRHRGMLEVERRVQHCSVAAECRSCGGALTVDCNRCIDEAAEASAEQRRALAREWLAARRKAVDEITDGKDILHGQTENVHLAFSLRAAKVGRETLDTHELMHLYLDRVEALRALFIETFELDPARDLRTTLRLYMFESELDHNRLAPHVAGGGGRGRSQKLMGSECVWSMFQDRKYLPDDEDVHRSAAHNVAHLLLANMEPQIWIGNLGHGWIDAGVAHWFEDKLTGVCANFCYEEVGLTPGSNFKNGRWRVPIRKMAEAGELQPFGAIAAKNTDQLSFEEHAQAFAMIDFLLTTAGGKKTADLIRRVKQKEATRDALRASVGLDPLKFDEAFVTWVRETYPLQERSR